MWPIVNVYWFFNKVTLILLFFFNWAKEMSIAQSNATKPAAIWFDGVDKRLLAVEMESKKAGKQKKEASLLTNCPLATLSLIQKSKLKDTKESSGSNKKVSKSSDRDKINPHSGVTDELAIDCEMVECVRDKNALARVSVVNLFGHPILDRYVAPSSKIVDYRTKYSGIRKKDLVGAPSFDSVQEEVAELIKNRIVVGHSIYNDFSTLRLTHPTENTRDTSQYYKHFFHGKTPSLKQLSETFLGIKIQKGEHDSIQDAQATMKLYVKERNKWNRSLTHNAYQNPKRAGKKKKLKTFYVST